MKYTLKITQDDMAENPYEAWDMFGTVFHWHRQGFMGEDIRQDDSAMDDYHGGVILPLYLYEHSGQTISTAPFSCGWDSGQVGWIGVTREQILKEYGGKYLTSAKREKARALLKGEVETIDEWLTGDVYGFVIEDEHGNHVDSLWGIHGYDYAKKEGEDMLEYLTKQLRTSHFHKLKAWIKNNVPLEKRQCLNIA